MKSQSKRKIEGMIKRRDRFLEKTVTHAISAHKRWGDEAIRHFMALAFYYGWSAHQNYARAKTRPVREEGK